MSKDYGKALNEYKKKAVDYFSDPKKISDLLSDAKKKAQKNSGPLDEVWNKLQLMFGIVRDWFNGRYREVPKGSIVAIIAGLIYFVSPVDLIPDVIPAIGITDDIVVLGLIIKQVSSDLDKYREWKENNGENPNHVILLVVDVQNGLMNDHPYNEQRVIENIKKLIVAARDAKKEVIYIRHDDGKGTDLEQGTAGWQIYEDIAPIHGELIFEKQYNSAFHKTGLRKHLTDKKTDTIIMVGLQTEYCMDATIKTAFDYEYKIIIPEETNTTFDNEYLTGEKLYQFYNYKIWDKRFADIISVEEAVKMLKGSLTE